MKPAFNFRSLVAQSLKRPRLLPKLMNAAWHFRRRDWYRRPPFLPLPSADYMRWRMQTAFGDESAAPDVTSLEAYLDWTAAMREQQRV